MSDKPSPNALRCPVIGIGASAGGLEALQRFFQNIPSDLGAAYVVVVHLAPDRESELPAILGRETDMPVMQVDDHKQCDLQPNQIYVIAPNRKLEMTDSSVGASRFEQPRGQRAAIDLFFRSLASAPGKIIAMVLSGGGSDGAVGAKAVKEGGGLVLVQDPSEAAHESMPRATIATGMADIVLPVSELARQLPELIESMARVDRLVPQNGEPQIEDQDEAAFQQVLNQLRSRTGHDFSKYKRTTVLRRLVRRMQLCRTHSIADYLKYLEQHVEEIQTLLNDLLITVTTFFRDPEAWAALQQQVVAELIERTEPDEPIRCWVPGCATGEEAYTLALLFAEELERRHVKRDFVIFASDVDEAALHKAREGVYPRSISADISDERLKRWFRPTDDHYRVHAELRDHVVFALHSVQRDPPFSRLHLITCRNLLIYLNRELQDQVMKVFRYACRDDGYLFLGASEHASSELFTPLDHSHRIYRAAPDAGNHRRMLPELPVRVPQTLSRPPLPGRADSKEETAAESHRLALEEVAPPSVLVDQHWNVLHISETAGRFLQPRGGPPSNNLIELVRSELRGELLVALRHALETRGQWLTEFVGVQFNGTPQRVAVLAQPRLDSAEAERPNRLLVTFLEAGPVRDNTEHEPKPSSERERALVEKLHQAEQLIDHLRADHHTAEEDLRAANEELQSLNEEYRSTTEELETSKEELQSINEELQTVNAELKGKLEEISRAHNDLENLMTATDIATLFLNRDLRIKRFTPQLASVFNVKKHDQGRPIGDITHHLQYDALEQDARKVLADLAPIERDVTAGNGQFYIARLRPYRTANDKIEGVVLTLVDVTKLKQTEQTLRDNEARFRALVDASAQIVWTADADGSVSEDSPSWRAFTGQTFEQWQGWGWLNAVHPDDRSTAQEDWRRANDQKQPFATEFRVRHAPSGQYRWMSVRAVPMRDEKGVVHGWVGMNIDIHERREAEETVLEADRRKDDFLAMLGHELRNPLAAIRSSIEVVGMAANDRDSRAAQRAIDKAFQVVERQSRHMTRLVNDLLDVARITRNKLRLEPEPLELCQCIVNVADALEMRVKAAGLQLEMDLPDAPLYVHADPERLMQVLDNLLRNAITFTESGGTLTLAAQRDGDDVLITVRDTGIGIEPDAFATLFDPYRQHHDHVKSGLGLGLTLVKRLVELHGGHITAYSEGRGRGAEFRITLPLLSSATPASAAAPTAETPRLRVLVVDDEADVADMLAALLQGLQQDVEVAYDGESAIGKALQQRPQLAFLDLSMPDMSGRELAARLREQFAPDELMLVAISGHDQKAAALEGSAFQHHVLKPAGVDSVIEALQAADGQGD